MRRDRQEAANTVQTPQVESLLEESPYERSSEWVEEWNRKMRMPVR